MNWLRGGYNTETKTGTEKIQFSELLLDETLCRGTIGIPREIIRKTGGINKKLKAKQKYELILRIAFENSVYLEPCTREDLENMCVLEDDAAGIVEQYGWQTDCYILGKYSSQLRKNGCFDAAVLAVLDEASLFGHREQAIQYLEEMIGHTEQYYHIDDDTRPILIYKKEGSVCWNVLTVFSEQLGAALERLGQLVIYFDSAKEDVGSIVRFMGKHFKAIIGMQSCNFWIQTSDETHYLHEFIYGPKFDFLFDHPIWGKNFLTHHIPNFHILALDSNYASFARTYYKQNAILFPPAGMKPKEQTEKQRIYEVSFVGGYGNYREALKWIREQESRQRFMANRFLLIMRKKPNLTAEKAFSEVLDYYHIKATDEEFVENMYMVRNVISCVMSYYREQVMRTILDSGIRVDVFGDSWLDCPLNKYPNLVCHPNVKIEEGVEVWKQSKLSLNVMSWHKGGFTERMSGIMLAGAVLVTDNTSYLNERYDENDMVIFELEHLGELPGKIRKLLEDDTLREQIAENGRNKTECEHTWDRRAEQFLELL